MMIGFYLITLNGYPPLIPENGLHSFGNVCLITHNQNSSFGNKSPLEKLANIINKYLSNKLSLANNEQIPNLKMIKLAQLLNETQWREDKQDIQSYQELISRHEQEMLQLFVESQT